MNQNLFMFESPTQIIYGAGKLETLGEEVEKLNAKKVLIVTDPGLAEAGILNQATDALVKSKVEYLNGKKEGYATWYFSNSEVSDYGIYKLDLPDGEFYSYHPNGLIKREAIYFAGELKSEQLYNEDGEKIELK